MDQYIGKLLDNRYEILDVIGVGGMAVVYKAYCHRLHRFVAVKVLRKDLASDAEFRRRFHDEAQAVAMLSHPNIVSVYDVSRSEELDYIVMELIDGVTLKQYMKKKGGSLSWREALHYITQIMRALSHAHSRGIIHRDIKPQNIMVLRDGSVRVADFGIARVMSAAQNTLTQEALGSVHYISPEQAKGSHIDERADLYSAGVVLYEMLTGRLPFEGDSPVSVAIQHISSIPLSPRELNEEIPEPLESITLKAMASNVDRRYKSAEDMIRDLEEFRKNPNVSFDHDHSAFLLQADEPTQKIDTSGSLGRKKPAPRSGIKPAEQYEYEIYDDYRKAGNRHPDQYRTGKKTMIPIIAVISVFLVGVGIFLWMFFFSGLFKTTESVTVPDLRGKTLEEVRDDEEMMARYTVKQSGAEPSDTYGEGEIMSQDPEAGSTLKGERITISVVISTGKHTQEMIDVTNLNYTEARTKLEAAGYDVKEAIYENHDEVVKNHVIESYPAAGSPTSSGDSVELVVSKGPAVTKVTVPSLIRLSRSEAEDTLTEFKLKSSVVEVYDDVIPAGQVVNQSIPATTEVDEGTQITIQVSKGPATVEPAPDPGGDDLSPPEQVKNKTISVALPTDREKVTVRVTVGGVQAFSGPVNTAVGTASITVSGSGKQEVVIYIDDEVLEQYDLNFDQ